MSLPFKLPILLDGATDANEFAVGMPGDACAEKWITEHPEKLLSVQGDYIAAGARAICAPTFGANGMCLSKFGLEGEVTALNEKLVALSRQAANQSGVPVGGCLSPTGLLVPPLGDADFDDIYDLYREQIRALHSAGVDFILIEAQTSLADMRAAVLAARTTNLPVLLTIAVDENGFTATGAGLLPAVLTLQAMGVDAIGLSGSLPPPQMLPLIEEIAPHLGIAMIAKPSLHTSVQSGAGLLSPSQFTEEMLPLLRAGAGIVSGCGGMTPKQLKALAAAVKGFAPPEYLQVSDCYAAAIEREAFFLGDNIIFSEPIECTSSLGDDLIDLDDEPVSAALVEINSLDDVQLLCENSMMTRLPIGVRSDQLTVLSAALRYFQGRLIVDSDCQIEIELIEPLAAKYGAIVY